MVLFNKIGIPAYLGAVSASISGYMISIVIALVSLKKECKLKYRDTINVIGKMIVPLLLMVIVVVLLKIIVPVNLNSKLSCVIFVAIISIVGGLVYGSFWVPLPTCWCRSRCSRARYQEGHRI